MVVIIRHKYATAHSKAAYLRQIGERLQIANVGKRSLRVMTQLLFVLEAVQWSIRMSGRIFLVMQYMVFYPGFGKICGAIVP
ncbi:MAG: hypothetical protein IPF63_03110 [Bacteroidetes bacterium]|nr:hypothetical protein [Bacteroidota bacterium]